MSARSDCRLRVAVLSGAGISAESGLRTFRDSNGLWAGYRINEVCTPEALESNRAGVIDFYNMRRREVLKSSPNEAHIALAKLEDQAEVTIVTQNIDDLHERAGSSNVIHVHGKVRVARSISNFDCQEPLDGDMAIDQVAADGELLRPHVCFFGESPYHWEEAMEAISSCDHLLIVGTSLNVYPAANLWRYAAGKSITLVDPVPKGLAGVNLIAERASVGVPLWISQLTSSATK